MPSERTIKSIRPEGGPWVIERPDGPWHWYPCGCDWRPGSNRWVDLCQYHQGFDAAAKQADELQALIDDFARTWADHVRTGSLGHERAFHALMAAATKDDDPTA